MAEPRPPLRLLGTLALRGPCETELIPDFSKDTGRAVAARWAPSGALVTEMEQGSPADAVLLTSEGLDRLIEKGLVEATGTLPLARAAVGLAVAAGAPRPDISNAQAVRAAFLSARAAAYSAAGASGLHAQALFERFGIVSDMRARAICLAEGLTGALLVSGEADLAIQQLSELSMVEGIDILGPLPDDIGAVTTFSFGIPTRSADPDGARALAARFRTPEGSAALERFGLTPAR